MLKCVIASHSIIQTIYSITTFMVYKYISIYFDNFMIFFLLLIYCASNSFYPLYRGHRTQKYLCIQWLNVQLYIYKYCVKFVIYLITYTEKIRKKRIQLIYFTIKKKTANADPAYYLSSKKKQLILFYFFLFFCQKDINNSDVIILLYHTIKRQRPNVCFFFFRYIEVWFAEKNEIRRSYLKDWSVKYK